MRLTEFTPDDIVDYLNQELPGFEPSLIRDPKHEYITLRVRTAVTFASFAQIPENFMSLAIHPHSYELQRTIDEYIRKTRLDLIQKLGLQKEIDRQVQLQLVAERQRIEQEAYRKAMADALDRVTKNQEEERARIAAGLWNTFMGRFGAVAEPLSTAPTDDDLDLDD